MKYSFVLLGSFKIKYLNVDYFITIPDGSYTATSLRDTINTILTAGSRPLSFNYNKSTNKYYIVVSNGIVAGNLFFYPLNCVQLVVYQDQLNI